MQEASNFHRSTSSGYVPRLIPLLILAAFLSLLLAGLAVIPALAQNPFPLTQFKQWSSGDGDWTYSLAWGDVDGDGDLELAAGNHEGNPTKDY